MTEAEAVLSEYEAVLVEMHAARIEAGGRPARWNELVDRMQRLHLRLSGTVEGRKGITHLALNGANETVRSWSAANALAWDAPRVRPILEAHAADLRSLLGLEAKIALQEFDAGRLNTQWAPKDK